MSQYFYDINGKTVNLATEATPKRISAYLSVFGKTKLSELIIPGKQNIEDAAKGMNVMLLDAIGDASTSQKILNACTDHVFSQEDAENVDSEIIGRIALDFFLSLIVKYFRQPK